MTPKLRLLSCLLVLAFGSLTSAFAASTKSYQVTGPIVALTPTSVTIQKGDENWEIARDPDAKAEPALKVGDRVTVQYRMIATRIEAKPGMSDDAKKSDKGTASKRKKD